VNTIIEVQELAAGNYELKAVQDQVITLHALAVDPEFLDRVGLHGVDGMTIAREAVEILVEHEALAAVPAESNLELLASHYPYLASELRERLSPGSNHLPSTEPARIVPLPARDRSTHT
jgi:hypothetical protein